MKKIVVKTLLALGLGVTFSGQALAESYQPARFGADTLAYLQAAVAPPQLTEARPVLAVYCQAQVGTDGLARNLSCYEKEDMDELRVQVEEALAGQKFVPARVDNEAVPVRMVFRVVYSRLEGQPPVMLLPNLGHMQGELGYQYSAPQERLDDRNWYALYRRNDWSEGQPFFGGEGRTTQVMAIVNEEGRVTSAHRIKTHARHRRDASEIAKALRTSRFIPGMVGKEPKRMRYFAVLHYEE